MPDAVAKPIVLLVVDDSHIYVKEPSPPVGVLPLSTAGVSPEQIVCAEESVLPEITGLTVISIVDEMIAVQGPDITVLRYQVVAVNAPGMYAIVVFVPDAAENPLILLVMDDSHK